MRHPARKRFGQHFLRDQSVIARIVAAIQPREQDLIVEIGPGRGALSGPLASSGCELHLIELDRDLGAMLAQRLAGWSREAPAAARGNRVHLHLADALRVDYAELTGGRVFRLAGNLPYNISTPLLFHVLRWSSQILDMHFMLQKEVVDRLAAAPGGRAWGRLSVMCQLRCAVEPLFAVPAEAFEPRPKVESAVIRLVPRHEPPVEIDDPGQFERVVARAFAQRRKTLRNSLRGLLEPARMAAAGVDPGLRPEALGLAEFAALARLLD